MRLTLHTDYALRVLVHVGTRGGKLVTINEIAQTFGISKNHLTKVVHQLGRAGYLDTVRGKFGGVRLQRAPEEVRLGDFIRHTEEDFAIAPCHRLGDQCRIGASCLARKALAEAVDGFLASLDRYTLADMIDAEMGNPAAA